MKEMVLRRAVVVFGAVLVSLLVLAPTTQTNCPVGTGTDPSLVGEEADGGATASMKDTAADPSAVEGVTGQCPTVGWHQGQTLAGFSPQTNSFFDVFTLLGPPDMTQPTPMPLSGLLFCLDYLGCGLHFGIFDADQNGQLSDQDVVRIVEGRAPYFGTNLQTRTGCVSNFFDVFVEILGPPATENVLPDKTDPKMQWALYPDQGIYLVNELGAGTPAIVRHIGIATPNDTVFQDIHNWLASPVL